MPNDTASSTVSDDVALRYLAQRNAMLEESSRLYVARRLDSGQFSVRVQRFLRGSEDWMKAAQPTDAQVREELALADERRSMWTSDINAAETWTRYYIDLYERYLPDVEFVPVTLSTRPADPAA